MVPALVCTFLRLSTTVHWVHPMPYKRLRVRLLSAWGDGPCMNLLIHVLRACSDSSQHKHLCVWVREASPLLPPHPRKCLYWNMEEKVYTGRKEVKGPPNRSFGLVPSPAHRMLWVWVQCSDKKVGTFHPGMKAACQSRASQCYCSRPQSLFLMLPWLLWYPLLCHLASHLSPPANSVHRWFPTCILFPHWLYLAHPGIL